MTALLGNLPGTTERLIKWAGERREKLRNYGLAGALLFFVAGLLWAFKAVPDLTAIHLGPLLILFVLSAPAGTLLNGIELHALTRISGGRMPMRTALELTLYTSAANMLPVPGGAVAKVAGMKAHGSSYRAASGTVVLAFLAWGGFSFLYSGGALLLLGKGAFAAMFALAGALLLAACAAGFARFGNWRQVMVVAAVRIAYFVVEALRYMLAFAAIGAALSFAEGSTFSLATFVGAAVVIAPQGLGVVEAATAMLAGIIGVHAGMGFIAAAIGRVVRLLGLALLTAGMFGLKRARKPSAAAGSHSGSLT